MNSSLALGRWLAANPAVDLMARLSYPKKIQLAGLVAGFSILLLTGQLFFTLAGQIDRAWRERHGIAIIQPLRQVIEPLQRHRGLVNIHLRADAEFHAAHGGALRTAIERERALVDQSLLRAEEALRQRLPQLLEDDRWLTLRDQWHQFAPQALQHDARTALTLHDQLIERLTDLLSVTADATYLSVDPFVGTFYLSQLVVRTLPTTIEQAARIRDVGAGLYASREMLRDDKNQIIALNSIARGNLGVVAETVERKVTASMPELKDELLPSLAEIHAARESLQAFSQFKLLGMLFDSTPTAFFAGMSYADAEQLARHGARETDLRLDSGEAIAPGPLAGIYRTLDHYTAVLDRSVEKRLWRLYQQLTLNLLVAAGALGIVIYTLYLVYVSFPIRRLIAATEQVAAGDLSVQLEVERNDEIGQLARSFNTMTESVRFMREHLEQLVAERTADLQAKNRLILESIGYARVIQQSYLRSSRLDMANTLDDYFMIWEPRDTVGGDYLYFRHFDDGYFFAVIDCTGHGVPGAFMTLIMASYLNNLLTAANRHDPASLLMRMNQAVKQALGQVEGQRGESEHASDDGMDAAFCWVDAEAKELTFAGARIALLVLEYDATEVRQIDGDKLGVGYVATPLDAHWQNHTLPLPAGTMICISTDGLIDQIGGKKRMAFGKKRLKEALLAGRGAPMEAVGRAIMSRLAEHQGSEARRDDVSLFGFRATWRT